MASDDLDGLLSQDDINKALAEAGMNPPVSSGSGGAAPADLSGSIGQDEIDAVLAEATAGLEGEEFDPVPAKASSGRVDSAGRPFDEVAEAMAAALESEAAALADGAMDEPGDMPPPPPGARNFDLPNIDPAGGKGRVIGADAQQIELLRDVELNVKIELGRSRMLVDDVLRLGEGSVVELDKLAGDPVDVFVNERLVARGEVLVLNDNFCVRINDIVHQDEEPESN